MSLLPRRSSTRSIRRWLIHPAWSPRWNRSSMAGHADRAADARDLGRDARALPSVMNGAITAREAARRMQREAEKNIADSN